MTAIIAGHTGSRCVVCGNLIKKGDPILFAEDDKGFIHEECEVDEGAWEEDEAYGGTQP